MKHGHFIRLCWSIIFFSLALTISSCGPQGFQDNSVSGTSQSNSSNQGSQTTPGSPSTTTTVKITTTTVAFMTTTSTIVTTTSLPQTTTTTKAPVTTTTLSPSLPTVTTTTLAPSTDLLVRDTEIYLWTQGIIPIYFSGSISQSHKDLFMQACLDWTKGTQLTCIPHLGQPSYLMVSYPDSKNTATTECSLGIYNRAHIYRIGAPKYYGRTMITLDPDCFGSRVLKQLMGAALGFIPEHQRTVRDSYLNIALQNQAANSSGGDIPATLKVRLRPIFGDEKFKGTGGYEFKPYDFGSIMQSPPNVYTNAAGNTMTPKIEYAQYLSQMGSSLELSTNDRQMVQYLYGKILPRRNGADCYHDGMPVKASVDIVNVYMKSVDSQAACPEKKQVFCTGGDTNGGILTGAESHPYLSCFGNNYVNKSSFKTSGRSCIFNGQSVNHLDRVYAFAKTAVPFEETCGSPMTKFCYDGAWQYDYTHTLSPGTPNLVQGGENYIYASCMRQSPASCSFEGKIVPHGNAVLGYKINNAGAACSSQSAVRYCYNGSLMGDWAYTFSKCN